MTFHTTQDEIHSFEADFYRFTEIKGPITLARFSDSGRGDRGRYGRFWLYGDYVQELADKDPSYMSLLKQISQQWAICDDWGDKGLLSLMDIPAGRPVPAMWGRTKFQPKVFDPATRQTTHSYEGGALQLIIPVLDTSRNIDKLIADLITRKLHTSDLVNKSMRWRIPGLRPSGGRAEIFERAAGEAVVGRAAPDGGWRITASPDLPCDPGSCDPGYCTRR